jgi:hypothetical protein
MISGYEFKADLKKTAKSFTEQVEKQYNKETLP